jgi:hypothetical protein
MNVVPSVRIFARPSCDSFQFELSPFGDRTGREILYRVIQFQSVKAELVERPVAQYRYGQ